MMARMKAIVGFTTAVLLAVSVSGCSIVLQKRHTSDVRRIEELEREAAQLAEARQSLEEALKKEIERREVKIEQLERGLVITCVADEILFDSGKAKLRPASSEMLDKIAGIITAKLSDREISIEGHTDDQPIKYSGWKSNWELSAQRALSVLNYFVDTKAVDPQKISAAGFGEYRPVASNETAEGRQRNRRVEIVILPTEIMKVKE